MAEAKTEGFRWLPSYYEAIRDLPDQDRLTMYDALLDFGFGNDVQELPPLLYSLFRLILPTLEKSVRFEQKQKANGQKGGRPKKDHNNPNETQTKPTETQTDFGENLAVAFAVDVAVDNAVDVDSEVAKPLRTRFVPPSVDEVAAYCRERGNSIDPQRFVDHYEANGWVQGKGKPIRNWRAAVRTWEGRERDKPAQKDAAPDLSWCYSKPTRAEPPDDAEGGFA